MRFYLCIVSLLLLCLISSCATYLQKPPAHKYDASSSWIENYSQASEADNFIEQINKMKSSGLLQDSRRREITAFSLGLIMARNSQNIAMWLDKLQHLNDQEMLTIHKALWFANTTETQAYLTSIGKQDLLESSPQSILSSSLTNDPYILDKLWSYFFITGKAAAIGKIITAFEYAKYADDPDNLISYLVFKAAQWSLASNIAKHAKVRAICKRLLTYDKITEEQRKWLSISLVVARKLRLQRPYLAK